MNKKEVVLNEIENLEQENKILKDNAEHNEKVVDKVNWENMLLKKENQELKKDIHKLQEELNEENLQCSKNAIEINDLKEKNKQLKDNWNKLKEWASNFYNSEEVGWAGCGMRYTLEKILELEQGEE